MDLEDEDNIAGKGALQGEMKYFFAFDEDKEERMLLTDSRWEVDMIRIVEFQLTSIEGTAEQLKFIASILKDPPKCSKMSPKS